MSTQLSELLPPESIETIWSDLAAAAKQWSDQPGGPHQLFNVCGIQRYAKHLSCLPIIDSAAMGLAELHSRWELGEGKVNG